MQNKANLLDTRNERNLSQNKDLRTMNYEPRTNKTNPIKAKPKAASARANQSGVAIFSARRFCEENAFILG
jgi:hypothetical protein